jgi:NAD(P)-dependent dehydrogenase (short-subunit alcohol dehydrogenase family)
MKKSSGNQSFRLDGKTALVTGAAGLLGREHAAALAEAGAHVVLTDIDVGLLARATTELEETVGRYFTSCVCDVTSESSIEATAASLPPVHILVNNAAVDPKVNSCGDDRELSRLENFPLDSWDWQLRVGLTGAFLCSRTFGSAMARRGEGVILNIASDLSVIAPDQRIYRKDDTPDDRQPTKPVTYSVVKAGLLGMTRYLAAYWADRNVRVNALSPGGVFNGQPDDFVKRLTNLIPMQRMADRHEYRSAVQFLCSPASSYMTGQNLIIDGGRTIL